MSADTETTTTTETEFEGDVAAGEESVDFGEPLLEVEGLTKHFTNEDGLLAGLTLDWSDGFPRPTYEREWVRAVDDATFTIEKGETLGLVGESGCGKSTLARTVLRLLEPTDGTVVYMGEPLDAKPDRDEMVDLTLQRFRDSPLVEPLFFLAVFLSPLWLTYLGFQFLAGVGAIGGNPIPLLLDLVLGPAAGGFLIWMYIKSIRKEKLRLKRKDLQMIYQDPQSSLNPRMKVGPIVEEPMRAHGMFEEEAEDSEKTAAQLREERAKELLERVGLDPQHYNRYPHQFSGGQRQRINLARALSVNPDLIVCDEPTSALDASIQAQVLNTMNRLQDEFGLTYLFISHDLSVIRHISDRVAVMYLGHLVEIADKEELFENPKHPYTESLLSAIPVPDPRKAGQRHILEGDVPSPIEPPSGCRFRTRCPELIAPDEYDLTAEEWDGVRSFMREVDRQSFEVTDPEHVRREFFGGSLPGGQAGDVVEDAIGYVAAEEWDNAVELLRSAFEEESVCASERPSYRIGSEYGDGEHFVACHLHRDADQVH